MKKGIRIFLLILIAFASVSSGQTSKPLAKLNFKDNKWQMVYIEDKSPDNGKFQMNIWLINDS